MKKQTLNDYLIRGPIKVNEESEMCKRELNYEFFMKFARPYLVVRDKLRTCSEKIKGLLNCF